MKLKSITAELLMVAPSLIAVLYVATIWHQIPTQIPSHYDITGKADNWAGKTTAAWEGIGLILFMYVLLRFLPGVDPKGRLQPSIYQRIRFLVMLLVPFILTGIFYRAVNHTNSQEILGPGLAFVSVIIAGIGNYMTTLKPNWFVGIRTPWTLDSEAVWRKTHQMGGRLLFAGGLLAAVLALVVPMPYIVGVVTGVISLVVLIPVVYSYIYFHQEKAHRLN